MPRELNRLLRQIPAGRVATYGDLAQALGDKSAARWVGECLVDHPHDDECPCHRVVRRDGDVGLYVTRDSGGKVARLEQDGVVVADGRVPLERLRFTEFRSSAPLAVLRRLQQQFPHHLQLHAAPLDPRHIGGVDASYISRNEAVASFVLVCRETRKLVWSTSVRAEVTFPYISGYLAFRELPIFLKLFDIVRAEDRKPDVTFVDGNGILHPRRAGSASCFGLAAETPTIGVGKKLLCGRRDASDSEASGVRRILYEGEPVGYAVRATAHNRSFFVSPGHLIDLPGTLAITKSVLGDRRLPLPIAWADRTSRDEAQRIKAESCQDSPEGRGHNRSAEEECRRFD